MATQDATAPSNDFMLSFQDGTMTRLIVIIVIVAAFQVVAANIPLSRESKRRIQHAMTGHILVQVSYILPYELCIAGLSLGACALAVFKFQFHDAYLQAVGPLLRPDELKAGKLPGAFWFLVGTTITALASPSMMVARYAVECLAFCDPMASFVGSSVRTPNIVKGSSVGGCLACFVTALVVGWWMLLQEDSMDDEGRIPGFTWQSVIIGALGCTVAEAFPIVLNDNLTIPIVTALCVAKLG